MNVLSKTIYIAGLMLAFSHIASAESLYASKIQPRFVDNDRDGVIAARDLCPGTPIGAAVDNNGCEAQTKKLLSVELNVLFDSGKSNIRPKFYSELRELAVFLKANPNSTVVIEGHTDDVGAESYNKNLSQARASSIADVLVDSFRIKQSRVKAVGHGESRPIATNDTPQGRERNRRVIAEVISEQSIANQRWTIYSVDKNTNTAFNSAY
ncbi:OmpA family protein [Marinomonas sp. C2222]|uniref:OmpA family protein n=1 Tax=Marinomonas sargassi TaxID=2984494 RepID=A0ABT2YRY6_9GAMM|nr:OmpA family protein [Marinomonas sargassi]MCV2402640.1 OmpA family protein [Marinomonas sargassi]